MNLSCRAIFTLLTITCSVAFAEQKPKLLVIDSYHQGYQWSDGIELGLSSRLLLEEVNHQTHYLDAKRLRDKLDIEKSTQAALKIIQEKNPDLVIVCDDIAIKGILESQYKNTDLPFVFCGLNWDSTAYDLPYKNTTGIVERSHVAAVIDLLSQHAKGNKIGVLSIDALSERRSVIHYNKPENHPIAKVYFVNSMAEWESAFKSLQSEVDMLILENPEGITNWNAQKATAFVQQTATIPIGSVYSWLAPLSLYTITNSPEEQGWWAGELAMQVIKGAAPSKVSPVTNKEGTLLANLSMANQLEIQLPFAILQTANIIQP